MVRILSLFFNPEQPLNKVNKSEREYDRFIFDIAKKTGFGTALLSAGGILYSRRVSSNLWTASWTVALVLSLLFIRRAATIIGNIDKADLGDLESGRASKPPEIVDPPLVKKADLGELESDRASKPPEIVDHSLGKKTLVGQKKVSDLVRQRSKSFDGSQSAESIAGSRTSVDLSDRSIPASEAKKKIERQLSRALTNSRNSNASEGAVNEQSKKEKMEDFVKVYHSKGPCDDAVYALRDLMNTDHVFGLQEFVRCREAGETAPSAAFLVGCLNGFKESEEGSSVHGFNKEGIFGVLSLLSATELHPTTPEVFHALCLILSDSYYRETFSDQTDKLITWLLQDDHYRLHHFKKLVGVEYKGEVERQQNSLEAASRTFIPVFEHFHARRFLVEEFLADTSALVERQYLLGWIVATDRSVEQGLGTKSKPFIQDAHEELLNSAQGKQPVHFLNRCLAEEGFNEPITKGVDHFRVHAVFCLLSSYLKNSTLSIGHQRILKMMLYILEGAEHLGEKEEAAMRLQALFMQLLGEAENQGFTIQVFVYLLNSFWCYRDTNFKDMMRAKKEIYDPIRDKFIAFFKDSVCLQGWKQQLQKQDNLNIYLNKLLKNDNRSMSNSNGALHSSLAR